MDDLQQALAALGLSWGDVWRLVADRRAGTLVVVAGDGRKLVGEMGGAQGSGGAGEQGSRGRGAAEQGQRKDGG